MGLFDLTGKNILITGGSAHLGYSIAEGLAEFGASIIITSRNIEKAQNAAKKIEQEYRVNCEGLFLDFENRDSVVKTFDYISTKYKTLDVLFNNSSYGRALPLTEMEYSDFVKGLDGTIGSVFLATNEALKLMLSQGHGNIINISSMYGIVSPNPEVYGNSGLDNPANYGAGKAAIIQFTKYLACNYGMRGIRANSICPGAFPNEKVQMNTEFINNLSNKTPLKRVGSPSEIKGVAVLLASDASSYITGQNYIVDGGYSAW